MWNPYGLILTLPTELAKINTYDKKYKIANTNDKQTEIKLKHTTKKKPSKCFTACTRLDSFSESFFKILFDSTTNKSNNRYTDIKI